VIGKPIEDLLEAIKKGPPSTETDEDEDEDGGISFDEAAKEML
jgi:hypothetical protein